MKEKKIARQLQSECGLRYTRALDFVRKHRDTIFERSIKDDKVQWREQPGLACSLYRELYGDTNGDSLNK